MPTPVARRSCGTDSVNAHGSFSSLSLSLQVLLSVLAHSHLISLSLCDSFFCKLEKSSFQQDTKVFVASVAGSSAFYTFS